MMENSTQPQVTQQPTVKTFDKQHVLIDWVKDRLQLKNDRRLSEVLDVDPAVLSRLRSGQRKVSSEVILFLHAETNESIRNLKAMAGLRCLPCKVPEQK